MTPLGNRLWNERYASGETEDKPPEPILISAIENVAPGRALDLACGLGRNSLLLASRGWNVTAVDYSEVALTRLRERCAESGLQVDVVHADLERGEFIIERDAYDLICDCLFLQRSIFSQIRDGVRPGGLFVGVLPLHDPQAERPMNPAFLAKSGELRACFEDWDILHYSEGRPGNDPARRLRAQLIARRAG